MKDQARVERLGDEVLRYCRRLGFARALFSHETKLRLLPPAAQSAAQAWMVDVASGWASESLWQQDSQVARSYWREYGHRTLMGGHSLSSEDLANLVDSLLMYLATDMARFPERKRFVQKVLGVGFWGRLLG